MAKRKKVFEDPPARPRYGMNWLFLVSAIVAVIAVIYALGQHRQRPIRKGPPPPIWEKKSTSNEDYGPDVKLSPDGLLLDSDGQAELHVTRAAAL